MTDLILYNANIISMDPAKKEDHLFSGFIQDEISLADDAVKLTIGSKIEHNDYSHIEFRNVRGQDG